MRKVTQEEIMGCGVACVASILGIKYKDSLKLFKIKSADKPTFYCKDIVRVLNKKGLNYDYKKVTEKTKGILEREGTIVFIKRSEKYPVGHYILRTKKGYMDPWVNMPNIKPAKSGFRKELPGVSQKVIYDKDTLQE